MLTVQHGKRLKIIYTALICGIGKWHNAPFLSLFLCVCVCLVATISIMSFVNGAVEALISPNCLNNSFLPGHLFPSLARKAKQH